jgi:hypothetical protein
MPMEYSMNTSISVPSKPIKDFCRKWKIIELSLFGSVLRDDFRPDSDVDVLVSFAPEADWGLLDHETMEDELSAILGRDVDLVTRRAVERSTNRLRRDSILNAAEAIYAAG